MADSSAVWESIWLFWVFRRLYIWLATNSLFLVSGRFGYC
jgi:hypothetical protein